VDANFRRKQVQNALPIFRNESIEENQMLNPSWIGLGDAAEDHTGVTMTGQDHWFRNSGQLARNVLYVLLERDVGRQMALVCAQSGEDRCDHSMAVGFE
jgi:hypothetical protein